MMQQELPIFVEDWFAWAPGLETRADWRAWAGVPGGGEPRDGEGLGTLPMMLRRRIDTFGQKVIGAALACDSIQTTRYIFASRHGEFPRTLRILGNLAQQQPPSPADFSLSIHHALAGLLSIHTGNKAGHTTISAGRDTFGFAMLEAAANLAANPDEAVLLVCYEEPLAGDYQRFQEKPEAGAPLVVALKLSRQPVGDALHISAAATESTPSRNHAVESNAIEDFLKFFLSGCDTASSTGERMRWRWQRAA
ncbi:beta-ketoacyl synthase chain length factor [Dongia soli]|uniref:Beta-ketoacyl synthase chain length factor n=1 Tax=Dongia soli TaxID=600628 RepID=A0ABU5EIA7_9PROT|nr:beta-ketoacyl synthase chain length factor [Dongia soli]MDY0885230.1 beta-ketoacyl synthase chain length factor [Dongia soli]